ncbi:MAG: alpha/beta hydrolase [Flavobacteriales bacterium]|nr:MAG: alpha/beta hydrolase [Flavobacteriales bacterium]
MLNRKYILSAMASLMLISTFIGCSKDDDAKTTPTPTPDNPVRYKEPVFTSTTKTSVNFTDNNDLSMDIYRPSGDENRSRPVIIFAHAGSFFDGSKSSQEAQRFCEDFAKRGYVTVNIDYRLGSGIQVLNDSIQMLEVIVRGTHDMKAAVRFMRKSFADNNTYGIDTSRIVVAGSGAGSTIALHTAYMNNQQALPLHIAQILLAEGGLHGLRGNITFSNKVHGCINLAGGINSLSFVEFGGPVLFSAQGTLDDNFPYTCGRVFESFPPTTNRLNLCGAGSLANRAASVQLEHRLSSIDGAGHRPWVNSSGVPMPLFNEVVGEITDFLFDNIITR